MAAREAEQEPEIRVAERRLAIWQTKHDEALQKIKRLSGSTKPDDQDEVRSLEGLLEVLDGEQPHVPPRISLFYEDATPRSSPPACPPTGPRHRCGAMKLGWWSDRTR
jgi:hypothetical protein